MYCHTQNIIKESMSIFSFTFSISISVTGIFLPTTTMTVLPHKSTPENEKKKKNSGILLKKVSSHTHIADNILTCSISPETR